MSDPRDEISNLTPFQIRLRAETAGFVEMGLPGRKFVWVSSAEFYSGEITRQYASARDAIEGNHLGEWLKKGAV